MKDRGQVFILLTLLVMIYLVLIGTAALELNRAEYVDPTPDTSAILPYVEQTNTYIEESVRLISARLTQGLETSASADTAFVQSLNDLRSFLTTKGISLTYTVDTSSFVYTQNLGAGTVESEINGTVVVDYMIKGLGTTVQIVRTFSLDYQMLAVNNGDTTVTLLGYVNGVFEAVGYASVTVNAVALTSLFNGTYTSAVSFTTGQAISATIDGTILLAGTVR